MPRKPGGKQSRAHKLTLIEQKAERDAAIAEGIDGGAGIDDGEPQLAPPARKKVRVEPTRKSSRGQPEKKAPAPRGPPAAQPKQKRAADCTAEELEQRRVRDRGYAKAARKHRQQQDDVEDDEAPFEADPSYGRAGGSKRARRCKKQRAMAKGEAWLQSLGDEATQAQALKDLSERKRRVAKAAGYHPSEEVETALFAQQQRKKALQRATATEKPRAGVSDDRRSFVEANLVGEAASPGDGKKPSLAARVRSTGLPESTGRRSLLAAEAKRAKLTAHEEGLSWSQVKARKGHSKITEAVRVALHDWVLNHPRVVNSPITNETLLSAS